MKLSFIRYKFNEEEFAIPKLLGMTVSEINKPDEIDDEIERLKKEKYNTIVITDELASFSEKLINKYKYDDKIKIIITPSKNKYK